MRINFEISDLEVFLAVNETCSFRAAARRLGKSQSAITRRVHKLEQALDCVLFERTTRAVKPTMAAKRLQSRAEAILGEAHETVLSIRDETVAFEHQRNTIVTAAVVPSLVPVLLSDALGIFRDRGHNARIRLIDTSANEVAEAVAQAEADFGLGFLPSLEPGTAFETLFEDTIVAVMAPTHELADNSEIEWGSLEGKTLILPARGTGNRMLIDEMTARERLSLHWSYEVERSTTARELAATGNGIALLPRSLIAKDLANQGVVQRSTTPTIKRPVGILTKAGAPQRPVSDSLIDAVRAAALQLE
ncbi:MAG: LysR family transcriptional regulator [Silicimonas sp.]|nr:LysR family transcriptional regulator [Silicimonas sp.]